MRGKVCTYVCVHHQEPRGPKESATTHSSHGTVFGCVVEQDQMWQATNFQTLIVVCKAKFSCAFLENLGRLLKTCRIRFISLAGVDLH